MLVGHSCGAFKLLFTVSHLTDNTVLGSHIYDCYMSEWDLLILQATQ